MPKKPLKKLSKTSTLDEDQHLHLVQGWCLDAPVPWHNNLQFPFRDETHRRELWFENRGYLMTLIGEPHLTLDRPGFPYGSRPDAWWCYETSEQKPTDELDTLRRLDLLFPGELEAYETQEARHRAELNALREIPQEQDSDI